MAEVFQFESIQLVLGEQSQSLRQNIRSLLHGRGFRNIIDAPEMADVIKHLKDPRTDMVLCDAELAGGDFCDAVHRMRHHTLGNNPFVITLATTGDPTVQMVRKVINSGVDDLLVKPLTAERLLERIYTLARARKPFVVTHDYIGPDRRKAERADDPTNTERIEVPNPLRMRARGEASALQKMIDRASAHMNIHKMQRYAVQVPFLVDRILAYFQRGDGTLDHAEQDLERLHFVCEDLSRRMVDTPFAHVAELAGSLIAVVGRLRQEQPQEIDLQLLDQMSQALRRAFAPEEDTAETAYAISDAVTNFTNRQ